MFSNSETPGPAYWHLTMPPISIGLRRRSEEALFVNKTELQSKVLAFVRRHDLIPRDKTAVIGVSGGADSVCLLHILANLRQELGMDLHVAHLNHQLRGADSEADAEYVSNLARSLHVPVTIDRRDVAAYKVERNCSIEEAARELRYAFLAQVAKDVGASRVAVGHTRDDQVETILMHILRGTGVTGLRGLAPCSPLDYGNRRTPSRAGAPSRRRGNLAVIRPLLDITREETAGYCGDHRLAPRFDSSNLSLSFFRNRLRLQLLPLLRQYNPGVDQALLRLADIAGEDGALIEQQISLLWGKMARQQKNAVYLDKKHIAALPTALQRQLVRAAITSLIGDTRDIEATHIEAARTLLAKPAGKQVSLPHGLICHGDYDELIITKLSAIDARKARQSQLPPCPFPVLSGKLRLAVPGETVFPGWKVTATIMPEWREKPASNLVACFDLGQAGRELFVRPRQAGDRFQPLGMDVPKKLYQFMVDARIPRSWRDCIPIVCSLQQIIWLAGWRIDDRVKITEDTKEILRLEFVRSE